MVWSKKQIEQHEKVAKVLNKIKDLAFDFIKENKDVTEYDVQQFIVGKFKEFGLKSDRDPPIVAFGKNTSEVHHFPKKKSRSLRKNDLILIDLWANFKHVKSPFADITWMGYNGKKVPEKIQESWTIAGQIRDEIVACLRNRLRKKIIPTGNELTQITKDLLQRYKLPKQPHYTGHSLGFTSAHGNGARISLANNKPLEKNLGYTIEPGIYFNGKFGVRSEINFYVDSKGKLVITTPVQKKLIRV